MNQSQLLRQVASLLDEAAAGGRPDDITLRHCLNERWFSDTLSWLVDPRGDHGLGVAFLREFTKEVARERCRRDRDYARRASHLKWSRAPGSGRHATGLNLGNAATFREFYLACGISRKDRGDRYCDVVVLDLDRADGMILVIENKLFGSNSNGQLRDQVEAVEDKYSRAAVREYVYLTLFGEPPSSNLEDEVPVLRRWVALSWTGCVFEILERIEPRPEGRLEELVVLLGWLRSLRTVATANTETVRVLIRTILDGGVACLLFELNRLCRMGSWTRSSKGRKLTTISHSTVRKRKLKVRLLADCSIAIQSKRKGRPQSDKLLLPFGATPRQVFNLVHITARDLYWIHFDTPKAYLRKTHRRRSLDAVEEQFKPVLNLIWKRRFELQALMGVMRCAEYPECVDLKEDTEKEEDSRW